MISVLISSRSLYLKLSKIDFENDNIITASVQMDHLMLASHNNVLRIYGVIWLEIPWIAVEDLNRSGYSDLANRNWKWIRDTVKNVPEQPVTLEIKEGVINLIFQY